MTQAVSPIPQAGDEVRAEDVEPNDTSAVSSELSDSVSSSQNESDASASGDEAPTPTAVRTAARQLERTCQDWAMVKRFGRDVRERKPGRSIGKRQQD